MNSGARQHYHKDGTCYSRAGGQAYYLTVELIKAGAFPSFLYLSSPGQSILNIPFSWLHIKETGPIALQFPFMSNLLLYFSLYSNKETKLQQVLILQMKKMMF